VTRDGQSQAERDSAIGRNIAELLALAGNDEACRLLGVEGALASQLDMGFLDDPLDWIAYDIAQGIKSSADEDGEEPGPTLSTLVAEIRLLQAMSRRINEADLVKMVLAYVEEDGG
jgi:hypothetical protein